MKVFNISLLFVVLALICSLSCTSAQDDAAPKRIALRRPVGKAAKATTTTAPPPPAYDEEGDYPEEAQYNEGGEEGEDVEPSSTTTTTTEAPKKIGPVIRPFRSNDDFLNSLKRRQMNAKKHRAEKPTPKSKPTPVVDNGDEAEESAPASSAPAAPSKGFKGNAALNRRKPSKLSKPEPAAEDAAAEESEQQQKEEGKGLKGRPHPRLSLRRRN